MAKWRDVKQSRVEKSLETTTIENQADEFVSIGARLKAFLIDSLLHHEAYS